MRDLWWNIPLPQGFRDWVQETTGLKWHFIRLPRAQIYGLSYGGLAERIAQFIHDRNPRALDDFGKSFSNTALPPFQINAFMPLIEAKTKYSFFREGPLEPGYLENLDEWYRSTPGTSELSKVLAPALHNAGIWDTSPIVLDNLIQGYLAGAGKAAIHAPDRFFAGRPQPTVSDIPGVGVFMHPGVTYSSVWSDQLYKRRAELSQKLNTFRNETRYPSGPAKGAPAITDEELGELHALNAAAGVISRNNQEIRIIQSSNLSPGQMRDQVDALFRQNAEVAKAAMELSDKHFK